MVYVKEGGVEEPKNILLLLFSIGYSLLSDLRLWLLLFLEYQVTDLSEALLEPLPVPPPSQPIHLPTDSIDLSDGLL
jgi:hypothetical protein